MAPASDAGWQLATTQFDLQPGQELFKCFHVAAPNDAVFPVGEWDAQMSAGSHHFILYRTSGDAQATAQGALDGRRLHARLRRKQLALHAGHTAQPSDFSRGRRDGDQAARAAELRHALHQHRRTPWSMRASF